MTPPSTLPSDPDRPSLRPGRFEPRFAGVFAWWTRRMVRKDFFAVRLATQHADLLPGQLHPVTGAQLAAAAGVDLAVDLRLAVGDQLLGVAAAGRQPGGLEQRVERDVVAAQDEVGGGQERVSKGKGGPQAAFA